ncbi:TPA: DNA-binding protein [Candidatus Micrarchaeota archaeon]|nr:DNA-binding protein [Candidatus Micrarchaeota archaeon]
MHYKRKGKELVVRLDEGDEIVHSLIDICGRNGITSATVTGIGALKAAELGHFDTREKKYNSKVFEGMFEIVSLSGNITVMDDKPLAHLHMVMADTEYNCFGGHVVQGIANPTCELVLRELGTKVRREKDMNTGLNLQRF